MEKHKNRPPTVGGMKYYYIDEADAIFEEMEKAIKMVNVSVDRAYINGARFGWNMSELGAKESFDSAIALRKKMMN